MRVPRSPLTLAAIATAAVPGLNVRAARELESTDDYDAASITDESNVEWTVRAPKTDVAGAAMEAELQLLATLADLADAGTLSFKVPRVVGSALLPEGGRAVVHAPLPGSPLDIGRLRPGPGLAADVGRVLADIHELPAATIEDVGLPVYSAEDYRVRRMAEVDEAARTGHVPTALLRRWEHALEDVSLWRFHPVVLHGDLGAAQMLVAGDRVVAITEWSQAKVADPADDLSWLLVSAAPDAVDAITEAYQLRRTELRDPRLIERALLVAELALARWLLHGVRTDQPAIISDAIGMLTDLAVQTAE